MLEGSCDDLAGPKDETDAASRNGLALPNGFRVHSMSMIKDPAGGSQTSQSTYSHRALLLIAYVSCHDGNKSCVKYAVYQLQTTQTPYRKSEQVLARLSAYGSIPLKIGKSHDFFASESVTGLFLAGGSFSFDLDTDAAVFGKTI